jgi:hypothetical protein
VPCLFDVQTDVSEFHDLSATHGALRMRLWRALNRSNLEQYMHRADTKDPTTDPTANRSPAHLLGACNPSCAAAYWSKYDPRVSEADENDNYYAGVSDYKYPICGVPGCTEPSESKRFVESVPVPVLDATHLPVVWSYVLCRFRAELFGWGSDGHMCDVWLCPVV